jgi:hypothetical protein
MGQLVVEVVAPGNPPPFGNRLAHAVIAAFVFGFDVVEVELPACGNPPPLGSVTP